MKETSVYRTESGMVFKVTQDPEGHLSVGILKESVWVPSQIGIIGLRVAPTTTRLTAKQVLALPD